MVRGCHVLRVFPGPGPPTAASLQAGATCAGMLHIPKLHQRCGDRLREPAGTVFPRVPAQMREREYPLGFPRDVPAAFAGTVRGRCDDVPADVSQHVPGVAGPLADEKAGAFVAVFWVDVVLNDEHA